MDHHACTPYWVCHVVQEATEHVCQSLVKGLSAAVWCSVTQVFRMIYQIRRIAHKLLHPAVPCTPQQRDSVCMTRHTSCKRQRRHGARVEQLHRSAVWACCAGLGLCHEVDKDSCLWAGSPQGCIEPSLGFCNPDIIVSNCADMPLKQWRRKFPNCENH